MPSGKQRTIRFFKPVVIDQDDVALAVPGSFWADLHDHIAQLPEDERRAVVRGRKIEGDATSTASPSVKFLYIAKLRPGADWPDIRGVDGTHATLASTGAVGALLEPAYLRAIGNTSYCAILRTSGGPTISAIERWLNQVGNFIDSGDTLTLLPYVRTDQVARLASAQGATRIRLHVEPDAMLDAQPTSQIAAALAEAQRAAGGGVAVDMTVSFGNARPDGPSADALVSAVKDILNTGGVKHASATLLVPDAEGDLVRDRIDFVKDRVTFVQEVGESEDEQPTPEAVMAAMGEAIQAFRKQL